MRKRENMFWQIGIVASVIITIVFSYHTYNMYTNTKQLWGEYNQEEVGTDKNLKNKVLKLEHNLMDRNIFKFKMNKNPGDLSNVINFEGLTASSYGNRHFDLEFVYSSKKRGLFASIMFDKESYRIFEGDTIAGGRITGISLEKNNVLFEKDGEIFEYFAE